MSGRIRNYSHPELLNAVAPLRGSLLLLRQREGATSQYAEIFANRSAPYSRIFHWLFHLSCIVLEYFCVSVHGKRERSPRRRHFQCRVIFIDSIRKVEFRDFDGRLLTVS